jgi:hypothetical protein
MNIIMTPQANIITMKTTGPKGIHGPGPSFHHHIMAFSFG